MFRNSDLLGAQEPRNSFRQTVSILRVTLPYDKHAPARAAKRGIRAPIARPVALDLCDPIVATGPRQSASSAGMTVPETAADQNHLSL